MGYKQEIKINEYYSDNEESQRDNTDDTTCGKEGRNVDNSLKRVETEINRIKINVEILAVQMEKIIKFMERQKILFRK